MELCTGDGWLSSARCTASSLAPWGRAKEGLVLLPRAVVTTGARADVGSTSGGGVRRDVDRGDDTGTAPTPSPTLRADASAAAAVAGSVCTDAAPSPCTAVPASGGGGGGGSGDSGGPSGTGGCRMCAISGECVRGRMWPSAPTAEGNLHCTATTSQPACQPLQAIGSVGAHGDTTTYNRRDEFWRDPAVCNLPVPLWWLPIAARAAATRLASASSS